jgi:PAS domain S-box-containing protein
MGDAEAQEVGECEGDAFGLDDLFDLSLDILCLATVDGYFKRVNPAFERTLGYTTEELVSRPFLVFVHPQDVERTRTALEVLASGGELREFENRYICRDGSIRWLQWNCRPGPTEGLVAAAARDVTDSLARQEQAALRRVATVVAHGAAPTEVFKAVAAEVAALVDCDLTLIGRYEPDATFTYLAAGGPMATSELGDRLTLGGNNLASRIRRSGQPESMNYDDEDPSGPIAAYVQTLGLGCAVGTPILVDDRIWGAMLAGWTQPREISPEMVDRIAEVTELVATAIANAESRTALVESRARVVAAADDTRRRIERDLHDGAQQRLVTLALTLRSHQSTMPADVAQLFGEVASGLEETLEDLRELAHGIHPGVLTDGGLGPALHGLARRAPLPVDVDVRVAARPPERIEVAVYYIVAEALTNVAKHAQASGVVVDVAAVDGIVRVSVADDGVGGADPSRGSGLLGLRDRVDALGGTMSLSSPSSGTALVVELPMTCSG